MVVSSQGAGRPGDRQLDVRIRIAMWSAMAAAIFWTLLYQRSQVESDIPEFVYVNF